MFGFNRVKLIERLIHANEAVFFYPKLKSFYKKIFSGHIPCILDVGANKGQTSDFFLNIVPNACIYCFEPNHKLYQGLEIKFAPNKNVRLFNVGISNEKGKLTLNETVLNETSTFEELNYDSEYLKTKSRVLGILPKDMIIKSYTVDVITLADFIRENDIKHIDVLKIDTEGHEYKCLLGLFNDFPKGTKIDYIQLEQHNDDMYHAKASVHAIDDLLKENGYRVYERIKHGFGNFEEVIYQAS